jgi:hypothetical protein
MNEERLKEDLLRELEEDVEMLGDGFKPGTFTPFYYDEVMKGAAKNITAALNRIRELEKALARIELNDTFWVVRTDVNEHTVVVEDDGEHHSVRVLGRFGKIASRAARSKGEG